MTPTTIDRPARRPLSSEEKHSLFRTLGFVLFLHLLGWGLLIGVVLELIALVTLPFGASRYPEWV